MANCAMKNHVKLEAKRARKWRLLLKMFEAKYLPMVEEEGIPFLDIDKSFLRDVNTLNISENKSRRGKNDISNTLILEAECAETYQKTCNKKRGIQPYRKCRTTNISKVDFFLHKNFKNKIRTHVPKTNSSFSNKTRTNIKETSIKNRNQKETINIRKRKSTKVKDDDIYKEPTKRNIHITHVPSNEKVSISKTDSNEKVSVSKTDSNEKVSVSKTDSNEKVSVSETDSFSNCHLKNIGESTSGYSSGYNSRRSSLFSDTFTDNRELIQAMIYNVSQRVITTEHKITLNILCTLNCNTNIPPIDKKCIRSYMKQNNYVVDKYLMFKLVDLMGQKEYKPLQTYILGMEVYQSMNDTNNEKFKFLCSQLEDIICKFLKSNHINLLEIFVDYLFCTLDCRKRKTKL